MTDRSPHATSTAATCASRRSRITSGCCVRRAGSVRSAVGRGSTTRSSPGPPSASVTSLANSCRRPPSVDGAGGKPESELGPTARRGLSRPLTFGGPAVGPSARGYGRARVLRRSQSSLPGVAKGPPQHPRPRSAVDDHRGVVQRLRAGCSASLAGWEAHRATGGRALWLSPKWVSRGTVAGVTGGDDARPTLWPPGPRPATGGTDPRR